MQKYSEIEKNNDNLIKENNIKEKSENSEKGNYLIFGKRLDYPILGKHYKIMNENDVPYIAPSVLDSSLAYIPVYTHLITFDLEPIVKPQTPPTVNNFKLEFRYNNGETLSAKSTKSTKPVSLMSRRKPSDTRSRSRNSSRM